MAGELTARCRRVHACRLTTVVSFSFRVRGKGRVRGADDFQVSFLVQFFMFLFTFFFEKFHIQKTLGFKANISFRLKNIQTEKYSN
jgi:hypothetical protein